MGIQRGHLKKKKISTCDLSTPKPKKSTMRMSTGFEGLGDSASCYWVPVINQGFPGGSAVKSMPAVQEARETRL